MSRLESIAMDKTLRPELAAPMSRITFRGYLALFVVFFGMTFSFGYQSLWRFDPRASTFDPISYHAMVQGDYAKAIAPFRYRVLVPSLAHLVLSAIGNRKLGIWDREFFSLLLVNSVLLSLAGLTLARLGECVTKNRLAGLIAAMIFLSQWVVVNETLGDGLVDSAQILLLLLLSLCLMRSAWQWAPLILGIGAFARETVFLFGAVFMLNRLARFQEER